MSENVKFNVIIPTRERADTLFHCLRTVIAQDYVNLSIIVSDNFSQDNTKEVVNSFSDSRIKYINTGKRVSMSANWEFALRHVTEGWVTIIGDDDGLLPGALEKISETIEMTRCGAIRSKWCHYTWPGSITDKNRLVVPLTSGIELRNCKKWLYRLMYGEANYPDLPCFYTGGFARKDVIDRARNIKGEFFLSMTPDIYSAIALSSVLDNYVMLNEPVAVAGVSSHSIGASGFELGLNPEPVKIFFTENNIPFHNTLAGGEMVKSMPILIYESYLQSIHLHHNFLNIKLEDQLGLALAEVAPKYYNGLREYCGRVASDNKISMATIDRKTKRFKNRLRIQELKKRFMQLFRERIIDCNKFGIRDVYGAAILAKAIFLQETQYAHWKLDYFFRLTRTKLKDVLGLFERK